MYPALEATIPNKNCKLQIIEVRQTREFRHWFKSLKDIREGQDDGEGD
jgi:hypothetical protein